MSRLSGKSWLLYGSIAAACAYACLFVWRTSFELDGERYFVLFDDAMVAMRYARNLATGYGLVWNPGQAPVEGVTNPLWTFYMAAWHLIPLPLSKISLAIQLSGVFILALNLVFVARIAAIVLPSRTAALAAVLLTGFYYPLVNWTVQGMEVGLLALFSSVGVYLVLRGLETGTVRKELYWLLGVGLFIRIDFLVVAAALLGFLLVSDREHRQRHVSLALIFLVGSLALQTALRLWYYGDILPNTYYLKMTGYPAVLRVKEGAVALFRFVMNSSPAILAAPLWLLIFRRQRPVQLLWTVLVAAAGYSVYVGGDAWETWGGSNRYLTPVMPLLFILISVGTIAYFDDLGRTFGRQASGKFRVTKAVRAGFVLVLLLINILAGASRGVWLVLVACLATGLLLAPFILHLRRHPNGEKPAQWPGTAVAVLLFLTFLSLHSTNPAPLGTWLLLEPPLGVEDNREMVRRAMLVREIATPDARVGFVLAGTGPYFAERPAIDFIGKTDPVIARGKAELLPDENPFRPGHMKWNYGYAIGRLKPDIIVQLWPIPGGLSLDAVPSSAAVEMGDKYAKVTIHGVNLYLLKASPAIRWDLISTAEKLDVSECGFQLGGRLGFGTSDGEAR